MLESQQLGASAGAIARSGLRCDSEALLQSRSRFRVVK
jgi:hypothetical protein